MAAIGCFKVTKSQTKIIVLELRGSLYYFPFKFNIPLVTIYTNLGESGVLYAIKQSKVDLKNLNVFTVADLLHYFTFSFRRSTSLSLKSFTNGYKTF